MKNKVVDSIMITVIGMAIAFTVAHCSGCAVFIPEGQMTMEVSDETAE
jgi:hypothetical protein